MYDTSQPQTEHLNVLCQVSQSLDCLILELMIPEAKPRGYVAPTAEKRLCFEVQALFLLNTFIDPPNLGIEEIEVKGECGHLNLGRRETPLC